MKNTGPVITRYLSGFCSLLRTKGLPISAQRTMTFLRAAQCIHLEKIKEVYWAGRSTLVDNIDNFDIYDSVFDEYFRQQGQRVLALGDSEHQSSESDDDPLKVESIGRQQESETPELVEGSERRGKASTGETVTIKTFHSVTEDEEKHVIRLKNILDYSDPLRKSRRYKKYAKGSRVDVRRSMELLPRNDGELIRLLRKKRRPRQRKLIILLDISGSMVLQLRSNLFLAYAAVQSDIQVRCFCVGTRLTEITKYLKHQNIDFALNAVGRSVVDWEGGTRLGDGVHQFLRDSSTFSSIRGAQVFILSDGLERGDPTALVNAVERIHQNSTQLYWISPLAGTRDYRPETRAMAAIAHTIGTILPGANLQDIQTSLLSIYSKKNL